MDDYENESLPVGEAQVAEAMQTVQDLQDMINMSNN